MNFKIVDNKFKVLLLPTLLMVMALNISSVADSFFIGTFIGPNGIAAIERLEPMIFLFVVFEWLFGLGGQILALNKKSEFDTDGSNRYFTVSMFLSFIVSLILAIIALLFVDPIATILGSSEVTKPLVIEYSVFLYVGFVASLVVSVLTQYIRVDDQPNFAAVVIIVANLVNILLDYLFLSYFKWGMDSVALATVIGYTVGLITCLYYIRSPKRTFRFVRVAFGIKSFLNSAWDIIKIGFPAASIGIFQVIFIYVLNMFIGFTLGDIGLAVCRLGMDALVIAGIVNFGISETLSSIVPMYYSKHDYVNLNHLIRISFLYSGLFALILVLIVWIWPEGFLALYNLNKPDIAAFAINALRLFSAYFILSIVPNVLIFYYEAIERPILSGILSVVGILIAPLASMFGLYALIGPDGIWISFPVSSIISIIVVIIAVKVIQSKETEYEGMFFIKKDLVEKTRNFVLTNNDVNVRTESLNHLKSLNASEEFCENVDKIFNIIFDTNPSETPVEMLVIDYDDVIHVDIKYDGEKENLNHLKDNFPNDVLNYAEVLGFNNIEYVMRK